MLLGTLIFMIGFVGLFIYGAPDLKKIKWRDTPVYMALLLIVIGGGMYFSAIGMP